MQVQYHPITFVESDAVAVELLNHIMWYCLRFQMLQEDLHIVTVRETAILLIESEIRLI